MMQAILKPQSIKTPFLMPVCILLGVLCILLFGVEMKPTPTYAWLSLLYYIALCWVVMKYYPAAFLLLLWFVFLRATTMISGIAIESGGLLPEMLVVGEPTGGFTRLNIIYTVGILGGVFMIHTFLKFIPTPSFDVSKIISYWAYGAHALTIFVCAGIFVIGLKHGFPLIEGMDRIAYWKNVSSRLLFFFVSNRIIFVVLLGMVFAACTGFKKHSALAVFIGLMLLSILFSEKFTSLSLMTIYFITPIFLLRPKSLGSINRYMTLLGFVITSITIPMILVVYGLGEDPGQAMEKFKGRAASQAQIWYTADQQNTELFKFDNIRVNHNIASMTSLNPAAYRENAPHLGARDFMANDMDVKRYKAYTEGGVSLTLAMEGYLLKLFGLLGMIPVYLFFLSIYCGQLAYLAYGIISGNPIRVIMAAKILVWTDYAFKQGELWSVLGVKSVLFMAVIIGFEIFVKLVIKPREDQQKTI